MSQDAKICECSHEKKQHNDGINLTKEKSNCCANETKELTNSNTLTTTKIELPKDIHSFGSIDFNINESITLQNNIFNSSFDKSHLPKLDIPILISSLLI